MSQHLILLRHAKSSWAKPNTADIDRPLKKRGRNDAALIGRWLNQYCFDREIKKITALVSPASRTCATFEHINMKLHDVKTDLTIDESLYLATDKQLLKIVQSQNTKTSAIMLVGHNPGMHELYERLSSRSIDKFPACAVACLSFDASDWEQVSKKNYREDEYCAPKMLRPED